MRTNGRLTSTLVFLTAVSIGCADTASITGSEAKKLESCPKSNAGSGVCRTLIPTQQAFASVFYDHHVQSLAGTATTSYANPTAAYLQATTRIDISSLADFSEHSSITDGMQTVSFPFSPTLQKRTVPANWATWSDAPYSESATPSVLYSTDHLFTALRFSVPVAAVGFELEGDGQGPIDFLVEYYDVNYQLLGFIIRTVEGWHGARLFSFSTDWSNKISQVDISAGGLSFAIAQVRYSLAPLPQAPQPVTAIAVDIKPGTTPNDVQRTSKGKLPVAVLTTPTFDAAEVDVATIRLGDETGDETPVALQNKKTPMAALKDVDLDGDLDLIVQFDIPRLVSNGDLTPSTTQLILTAMKVGGGAVRGVDNVVVKP